MPVDVEVSVDFENTTDFTLYLPQGFERHFSWGVNQTHSDVTFDHTFYEEFDEATYCTHSAAQAEEYKNISTGLNNMLGVCTTVVDALDNSADYQTKIDAAESDSLEYERLYTLCQADKTISSNETASWKARYEESQQAESELETCQNALDSYKDQAKELNTCKGDVDDCKKSKNNTMIFATAVGLGVGYFIWGRKKKGGPSEQAESGYVGDDVVYREQPDD
jgi:hypothetical protein